MRQLDATYRGGSGSACVAELWERLDVAEEETPTATLMIGRRDYGWLVRGLSRDVPGVGSQNYECRLDHAESRSPTLTYLRLCPAGDLKTTSVDLTAS